MYLTVFILDCPKFHVCLPCIYLQPVKNIYLLDYLNTEYDLFYRTFQFHVLHENNVSFHAVFHFINTNAYSYA